MVIVFLLEALLPSGMEVVTSDSYHVISAVGWRGSAWKIVGFQREREATKARAWEERTGGVPDRLVLSHQRDGNPRGKTSEGARVGADVNEVPSASVCQPGLG